MEIDSLWGNIFKRRVSNDEEDIITILRKVPVFEELGKKDLEEFAKIVHRRLFKANEVIFWEGEPGVGMYIIQNGAVEISKMRENGQKEVLAVLKDGDFFGELALLDESPRSATALALEESHIIGLFRPDLFDLLYRKPQLGVKVALKLAQMIGERLRQTNESLQLLRSKLEERHARK